MQERQSHELRELHDIVTNFMNKKPEVALTIDEFKTKLEKVGRETFIRKHWFSISTLHDAVLGSIKMRVELLKALEDLKVQHEGRHEDQISNLMAALDSWVDILREGLNVWTHATSPQSAD